MNDLFRQKLAAWVLVILAASMVRATVNATIPPGTAVQVRIVESLSSETASVGDLFHGTLVAPVVVRGKTMFPKGAQVTGEVVHVERSGRLSSPGELHLRLRSIRSGARTYAVSVAPILIKGDSHAKSNVTKIGGGATAGAIIGAIAGGGKGAAIGAGVGAAAGTGAAAATGKKAAKVESEAVLEWVVQHAPARAEVQEQQPRGDRYAEDQDRHAQYAYGQDQGEDYDSALPSGFSARDRRITSECFVNDCGFL